jgi:hypothetical protein
VFFQAALLRGERSARSEIGIVRLEVQRGHRNEVNWRVGQEGDKGFLRMPESCVQLAVPKSVWGYSREIPLTSTDRDEPTEEWYQRTIPMDKSFPEHHHLVLLCYKAF